MTSKFELARKDSFSIEWMSFLPKEFLVSSSELGQVKSQSTTLRITDLSDNGLKPVVLQI